MKFAIYEESQMKYLSVHQDFLSQTYYFQSTVEDQDIFGEKHNCMFHHRV